MKVNSKSSWSKSEIIEYLDQADTPLRISSNDSDGYPVICSLWFVLRDGFIWAASHKNSHIVKVLKRSPKVGFEVANNEYPYKGVRGKGEVTLVAHDPVNVLEKVINKYLKGSNQELSSWLLSRKEDEYSIMISPLQLNSWDFSDRMESQR